MRQKRNRRIRKRRKEKKRKEKLKKMDQNNSNVQFVTIDEKSSRDLNSRMKPVPTMGRFGFYCIRSDCWFNHPNINNNIMLSMPSIIDSYPNTPYICI